MYKTHYEQCKHVFPNYFITYTQTTWTVNSIKNIFIFQINCHSFVLYFFIVEIDVYCILPWCIIISKASNYETCEVSESKPFTCIQYYNERSGHNAFAVNRKHSVQRCTLWFTVCTRGSRPSVWTPQEASASWGWRMNDSSICPLRCGRAESRCPAHDVTTKIQNVCAKINPLASQEITCIHMAITTSRGENYATRLTIWLVLGNNYKNKCPSFENYMNVYS